MVGVGSTIMVSVFVQKINFALPAFWHWFLFLFFKKILQDVDSNRTFIDDLFSNDEEKCFDAIMYVKWEYMNFKTAFFQKLESFNYKN